FTTYDRSFGDVLGASPRLHHVVDVDAHEGPVYSATEDALYFTSRPTLGQVRIKRLQLDGTAFPRSARDISVVPADTVAANGMTGGPSGSLLVCEQGSMTRSARISQVDPTTGRTAAVVTGWRGLPLNSPNDVVVGTDGSVWFTDPSYGHLQGFRPQPKVGDFVYRHDPETGATEVVDDSFDKPNGIAFSPDGGVLYVTDSGANQEPGSFHVGRPHHVVAFDVIGGRRLTNRRVLAVTTPGFPDGLKVDVAGRVYVSSLSGVQVLSPAGDLLGQVDLPGAVNFAFGGPARNVLYITSDTAVWAAVLDTQGT
ncbi:MAG: SMP-30/gluconolactonase/LRE family protein, partial [Actinomycetes bacterium]